ncbi:uncharacterized protein LOC126968593 [Leptidea sinapis]|uniref:uncharacterized protein LOC126968593 n=1 Tax=Leptidea sinapis TaxID=189913 RepID=UPI0021416BB5|nr:uncharacterized protein LOC126968593 [Leptidea sinapis]XP_050669565.1 uncharacterized protein LOC126968593 [Leptidea sinapis]
MSFLSTTENVGFSGIPQKISDASCASQYKMAVESVPGTCNSEVNMFIHDATSDDQNYIPHLNDNFFHTRFKIDPNDLYTFHDSDVIAGEITVSHTEDNFTFSDNTFKTKLPDNPIKDLDILDVVNNGHIKEVNGEFVVNGHFAANKLSNNVGKSKEIKSGSTKVQRVRMQNLPNNNQTKLSIDVHIKDGPVLTAESEISSQSSKDNSSIVKNEETAVSKAQQETFLDVFKREQGLNESQKPFVKSQSMVAPQPATPVPKKPAKSKPKKGRGPILHEALQRIPSHCRVIAVPNKTWHAPGEELFQCGPLDMLQPNRYRQVESSSDDDNMPDYESASGSVCVEETSAESRSARLELRRAAMRRHVMRTACAMRLARDHEKDKVLATLVKKQLSGKSTCRLPPQTVNHLLAMRGMSSILSLQERRKLRQSGWSGGEGGRSEATTSQCFEESCQNEPLPCARYCLSHVTLAADQRLYASCAAVFAGGERCKQPLLPLQEQLPLCAEHAWKRDNYEMLCRESKPQKIRKRAWGPSGRAPRPPRPPRKPKRRRRLVLKRPPVHTQSLSEINACSNSSAYDSSEDAIVGDLTESEYITGNNSNELEVGQVPPDDILDPSVLSQIPDEAFTEFFNQAEGSSAFAESSELAAALEAVLDERVLDERALEIPDCVFSESPVKTKTQVAPVSVEQSSSTPS